MVAWQTGVFHVYEGGREGKVVGVRNTGGRKTHH